MALINIRRRVLVMKRVIVLSILVMALWPMSVYAKVRVVTTTTDLADAVRAVGGSRVQVSAIAPGYQDPHHVETKPSYLMMLRDADAFVMTGLDLEVAWAPALLRNSRNPKIQPGGPGFLDASHGILVLEKPTGGVDRTMGDIHPLGNPHYTMSPLNMKKVARNIAALLKAADPAGSLAYDQGYRSYWTELNVAEKRWQKVLAPYAGQKIVTYHSTWSYFAKFFKLDVIATIEPKPGISPSSSYLDGLVQEMAKAKVKVIVAEPWQPESLLSALARRSGAKVLRLPIEPGGIPGTESYIKMMDLNVGKLVEALR